MVKKLFILRLTYISEFLCLLDTIIWVQYHHLFPVYLYYMEDTLSRLSVPRLKRKELENNKHVCIKFNIQFNLFTHSEYTHTNIQMTRIEELCCSRGNLVSKCFSHSLHIHAPIYIMYPICDATSQQNAYIFLRLQAFTWLFCYFLIAFFCHSFHFHEQLFVYRM